MSSIPTSAMPRAGENLNEQSSRTGGSAGSGSAFGQIADKAREYPKTAMAAGAAVAAGVVAATALGVRGRRGGKDKKG